MNPAQEGQIAVETGCNCDGTVLVAAHMVDSWRCARCNCKPKLTGRTVTLGRDGALPAGWSDQPVESSAA